MLDLDNLMKPDRKGRPKLIVHRSEFTSHQSSSTVSIPIALFARIEP